MSVQEFVRLLSEHSGWVLVGGIVLGTVAIKKLELPIWQWIVGWINARLDGIGRRMTASLVAKVDEIATGQADLQAQFAAHVREAEQERMCDKRRRIIDFSVGLSNEKKYDYEAFRQILKDITDYEDFCRQHPEFPNAQATGSIQHIMDKYQDFLNN